MAKFLLILSKNISLHELKQKITISKLMVEILNNDLIKQYYEIRKISTGQRDDYTTGCLLTFVYFEKNI